MDQDSTEHPGYGIISSDQRNRKLRKGLGGCQRFQSLAHVAEIVLDPKLAYPKQAAPSPHLQFQGGERNRRRQAAAWFTCPWYGQANQAHVITKQGEQPVVLSERAHL
jgi:hypothetical protein